MLSSLLNGRLFLAGCILIVLSNYALRYYKKDSHGIVLYATNRQYLCNALINIARLRSFNTKAQLIVLLPEAFLDARPETPIARLVASLQHYNVHLKPLHLERAGLKVNDVTYEHSLQKLEILGLSYEQLLYFDSDGLILQKPDKLFNSMPKTDLTLPEAYYVGSSHGKLLYSSAFMLVRPSQELYRKAQELVDNRGPADFDMEIFDRLTHDASVSNKTLPYRHNLLLTGLFRDHSAYSRGESWDSQHEWDEAMYIHFSDAPIPKPWIDDRGATYAQHGPKCSQGGQACDEVRIWRQAYKAFRDEMHELCPSPKELDL